MQKLLYTPNKPRAPSALLRPAQHRLRPRSCTMHILSQKDGYGRDAAHSNARTAYTYPESTTNTPLHSIQREGRGRTAQSSAVRAPRRTGHAGTPGG